MTEALQQIIERVRQLGVDERAQLRQAIDALPPSSPARQPAAPADQGDQLLLEAGIINSLPAPRSGPRTNPRPIRITGKPLSETIIEERR